MPASLRVGVIIDSLVQPRWVRRCVEKIVVSAVARVELVVKVEPRKNDGSLLYRLYNRIDSSLFAAHALEPTTIEDLLKGVAVAEEFKNTKGADLDVLVNFGSLELNLQFAD